MSLPSAQGSTVYLVGDVGGTNCRLALAEHSHGKAKLSEPRHYRCADFAGVEDAIGAYLGSLGAETLPDATVIAVAGPVSGGFAALTNGAWRLSEESLRQCGFAKAKLVNDYAALALAVEQLTADDVVEIGPSLRGEPHESVAVLGAGTGLGVGALARGLGTRTALSTEGGHVGFAPADEVEIEILTLLSRRFGHVSTERLLSGPGMVNLYGALAQLSGAPGDSLSPEQIILQAQNGDRLAGETLDRFCAIYGSMAGDVALMFGARGGLYLGGGIAPAIAGRLQSSAFRERFETKGRFQAYLAAIPTRIIVRDDATLLGSAYVAHHRFRSGMRE